MAKKLNKRKKKKGKVILAVLAVILLLLLFVVAFVLSKLGKMDNISIDLKDLKINDLDESTEKAMKGYTTIALFGLDNRENGNFEGGNSDTIIVASINNDTGEIKMASVYRDTYMDVGDNMFRKANAGYANGGPKNAMNMLNKNLDLKITDYVAVDFNALVEVIDQLGGIEIEVTAEEAGLMTGYMDEIAGMTGKTATPVSAGLQTLDGVQATAYARIRYTVGWDYKRTERQRLVITKIFEKAKSANIGTLNSILDTVLPDVSTSLSATELLGLATKAGKYNMGDSVGFPFEKTSGSVGNLGDMVIAIDFEANVIELHKFLYDNESYTPSSALKELSATIKNNTGY